MTRHILDDLDMRALRALDPDVIVSPDGESATISADIEVTITRAVSDGVDLLWLRFKFPGEPLDVKIRRAQLLSELDVEPDKS